MAFLVINELSLVIKTRLSKLVSTYLVGSPDPQELNPFYIVFVSDLYFVKNCLMVINRYYV